MTKDIVKEIYDLHISSALPSGPAFMTVKAARYFIGTPDSEAIRFKLSVVDEAEKHGLGVVLGDDGDIGVFDGEGTVLWRNPGDPPIVDMLVTTESKPQEKP